MTEKIVKLFEYNEYLPFSCNLYDSNTRSVYWILVSGFLFGAVAFFFYSTRAK